MLSLGKLFNLWRFHAAFAWPSFVTVIEKLGVCSVPLQDMPSESSKATECEKYFQVAKVWACCPDTLDVRTIL